MNKPVIFTKHAKERLWRHFLTEEDTREMLKTAIWYTLPLGNAHHKLNTKQNQFGIVYYIYKKKHKDYPTMLFTLREYKESYLVITATKKEVK